MSPLTSSILNRMATQLQFLEAKNIRFWRPSQSVDLRTEITGDRCILATTVRRTFPLSQPTQLLSLHDGAGKEVGILRDSAGLDSESLVALEEHLDRRYFTPRITTIESLKQEAGMWHFIVQTQRGVADFYVRNWRDNATEIAPNRWHITSVDGGRLEILNLEALDAKSRTLLDQLL